jgi:hypothetical protein
MQFSKEFTYFQCKIAQKFSISHCTCEDGLAAEQKKRGSDLPIENISAVTAPDEFYTAADSVFTLTLTKKYFPHPNLFRNALYTFCFCKNLWHPPCC